VDNPKELTGLSACYGYGGLDEGVDRALDALRHPGRTREEQENWYDRGNRNIRNAAILEIEAVAAYNVVAQMEKGLLAPCPVWTDLRTFPWENFYRKVHIFSAGFPCQPFSQAGLQGGTEDPRHLFPYLEQGVDAVRPVLCWFENVANLLNIGFEEVRYRLQCLGYKVEAGIYAAEHVGAPHLRKRLFIMAVADTYCTEQSKRRGDLAEVLGIPEIKRQPKHSAALSGGNSHELGNSDSEGQQQQGWDQRESWRWDSDTSENVDNTISPRLEGYSKHGSRRSRWQDKVRSIAQASLYPAGQGKYQHSWEEPRLESSVGFSVDGYQFTEDLLRLAGNGVVPKQAEIAFLDLITEHFL
jgi:DNA (cytosine-5)-methyltransferase 1